MSKLVWDAVGERLYETGVDRGVLFPFKSRAYQTGVAWNGLTAVNENSSGAEPNALYADNIKYLSIMSNEEFAATIEAFMYPDEFEECDGTFSSNGLRIGQQKRIPFGLSYRSKIGSDENEDLGYKIHFVYNALAAPSEKGHATINESPEAATFSWSVSTTPIEIGAGFKPAAHLWVSSIDADATKLANLENLIYGADEFDAASTYAVGTYVTYGSGASAKLYVCKTAITVAAAWDNTKWDEIGPAGPYLPSPQELITIMGAVAG